MKITLALLAFLSLPAHASMHIFGEVPFVAAGNLVEFQATFSQTTDEARQELLNEFGSLYLPSVMAGSDAESAANALLKVIITLDRLRDEHVARARDGIPAALEAQLLAQFDSLFRAEGLTDGERRAEIVNAPGVRGQLQKALSPADRAALARFVLARIDTVLYGTYTVADGGSVILSLSAEKLVTGEVRVFTAQGSIPAAVADLAQQLFRYAQANERAAWKNPLPSATWLLPPPNIQASSSREAKIYCEGQGARLPYARELVLASQGGDFRAGGIPAIAEDDVILVADLERSSDQLYYFGPALTRDDPRGPVRSGVGMATLSPRFACVRGAVPSAVQQEQDLFRAYRRASSDAARTAIEFLLARLDAFGSRARFADRFDTSAEALNVLRQQGVVVGESLRAKLAQLD